MMRVETNNFEFAHGHKPRGRGNWAFDFERGGAWTTEFCPTWQSDKPGAQPTFGEARRWALQFARELGASRVQVAS